MRAQPPLLERDDELDRITAVLDSATAGAGRLLVIEAPAGVGKTRLVEEAREMAQKRNVLACSARPTPLERAHPFGVVRQLLEPALRALPPATRRKVFGGAAGLARPVLLDSPVPTSRGWADPEYPLLHGLYWTVANLSQLRPLLLCVDDAQWADAASLRTLTFLAPRIGELAISVVLAVRPGDDESGLVEAVVADPTAERLAPSELSLEAVAALAEAILPDAPEADFVRECHRLTGGNPFFTNELLAQTRADRLTPTGACLPRLRHIAPAALSGAIVARLAGTGPGAAGLAHALAVLGDGAPLRQCCELAGLSLDAAAEIADRLIDRGILAPAEQLSFVHPIVRSSVYEELGPHRRAALHRSAAKLLRDDGADASIVAAHLVSSPPEGDPANVVELRRAAEHAVAAGSYETAAAFLSRALEEPPPPRSRLEVLVELGSAEIRAGQVNAAAEHLERAVAETEEPADRVAAARELARARLGQNRFVEAVRELERAAEIAADDDPELALRVEAELATAATFDFRTSAASRKRVLARAREVDGSTPAERVLLAHAAWWLAFTDGTAEQTRAVANRALADGRLLAEETSDSVAVGWAIAALVYAGEFERAQSFADEAVEEARRRGSAWGFSMLSLTRAHLGLWRGNLVEAEADARAAHDASERRLPYTTAYIVHLLVERGEVAEARAAFDEAGLGDEVPPGLMFTALLRARAQLHLAEGSFDQAVADLREARRRRVEWAGTEAAGLNPTSESHGLLPLALHLRGEGESASEEAAAELEAARRWGAPRTLGRALRIAGSVTGGEAGVDLVREAIEVLESSGAELELASALVDLGAAMRRAKQRAESRAPLRRGMELAHRCGARGLVERAREELRATGARPRRAILSGVEALTAAELRVARMAAAGMSNPEIAQALFVTRATVESQLVAVYRKLDVSSRTALPKALGTAQRAENFKEAP